MPLISDAAESAERRRDGHQAEPAANDPIDRPLPAARHRIKEHAQKDVNRSHEDCEHAEHGQGAARGDERCNTADWD